MSPYRSVEPETRAEAPRDPGIVGEIIGQFADPLAFYRELVQNAIDAGTPAIEVRIEHAGNAVRASVRDRGEGMTREIIENQLLVLFRSTKERDATKIGKFGIGFASVLAPKSSVVTVQTVRAGRRLTVHLYPDLTYQLFDGGAATQSGTIVELELPMDAERAVAFANGSRAALVRWCRHASVPIQFDSVVQAAQISARIDRPLAIEDALVEVRGEADGGALVAVVGLAPPAAVPYAGFFNHGLMLYETREYMFVGAHVAIKVQDARLGHTLSRDNVRRDKHFDRAMEFTRELFEQLPAAAARALREAAAAEDRARYETLTTMIPVADVKLSREQWTFPLVEPVRGERWIAPPALHNAAWWSASASPVTAALARAAVPVIYASSAAALARVRAYHDNEIESVEEELTLVELVELSPNEHALVAELGELLGAAHRAPVQLAVGRFVGAGSAELAIAARPREPNGAPREFLIERADALRNPFKLMRRRALVLSAAHPLVAAALRAEDPRLAASHLARALLLRYRLLDVERSEAILARALARLGVA